MWDKDKKIDGENFYKKNIIFYVYKRWKLLCIICNYFIQLNKITLDIINIKRVIQT